ncbi:MAG: tetratricopeptide repeat protein [Gemmatimonadota bacterium]|nr:MAG: tetratricopeptide repeat protein [Gemmatimonadota bacterium]
MQRGLKFRPEVVWSTAALALFVLLSLAGVGCGGDETSQGDVGGQATLPPPLPPVETTLASDTPEVATEEELAVVEPREVSYEEAESTFLERRYAEAVDLFMLYAERRAENPWGHYMLGLSAWKSGDNWLAEEAFRRALELDSTHVKSWLNLARVLLDEERADEALEMIDEALALEQESNVALRLEARAYHQLGLLEEAIDSYRQAILIDDEDAWSMNNMGLIYIEQERFDEALRPLARAVGLSPDIPIFHNNLGVALERTGHYRAAEDAFRAVLAIDDTYEKAEVSLVRVAGLEEDPDLLPVDLAELAQRFVDEVEGWREAVAWRDWQ